jgi:peroxiredoxin
MRTPVLALVLSYTLLLFPVCAQAAPEIGKPAPDFTATAVDGATVKPSDYPGKIVVMEWNNPLCPFVRKHYDSGSMQKLQAYAREQNVVWLAVNSGGPGKQGNMDTQQAKDYIAHNHLTVTHYILDPKGAIGRLYGAKATPHMFIIDTRGNIAYMGAIDDRPTPDPASLSDANNYVRAAVDSLGAGKSVAVASTQAYGCSVKYGD